MRYQKKLSNLTSDEKKYLAKKLKIQVRTINHWISGRNKPTRHIKKLAEHFNCKIDDLFYSAKEELHLSDNSALIDEFALIPKYKTRLSGGSGSLETSDQIEANLAFRKDWLNGRNVSEKDLALFEVVGDSMAPCISHGSIVMVDRSQAVLENIIDGKIYAFREDNVVKIKRIWIKKRSMVYESDNEIEGDKGELYFDEDDFEILGKIIWAAHEVR